jgi:ABC-type glycerol-3-phosphate transport system substrate-binding protein
MKKTAFQQKDEFTEAEALTFWLEWVNTHTEHEFMVMRNIMAIQKNLQENWNASHPETKIDYKLFPERKVRLGDGGAALILYRLFEKGYLPIKTDVI